MNDAQACRALWCAVINNAAIEANGSVAGIHGKYPERTKKNLIRDARDYLTNDSRDLRLVCDWAGVDAWRVREAFKAGRLSQKALTGNRKGSK